MGGFCMRHLLHLEEDAHVTALSQPLPQLPPSA
jgi:hypothetical protein